MTLCYTVRDRVPSAGLKLRRFYEIVLAAVKNRCWWWLLTLSVSDTTIELCTLFCSQKSSFAFEKVFE